MKYNNELEIKEALGITDWRNLSKANVTKFAAMMPDMDKEVALKIVEQFPEFKKFALQATDVIERQYGAALAENSKSQAHVHSAMSEIRLILKEQLSDDDISWEERKYILDMIMETAKLEDAKDTENKNFLKDIFQKGAIAVGGLVALGVVFVGGRLLAENQSDDSDEE